MRNVKTARVFKSGNSQAVRLPKEFQLDVAEVHVFRKDGNLVLWPIKRPGRTILIAVGGLAAISQMPSKIRATLLDWPSEACQLYGKIHEGLQKQGTPIGAMDLLIAVHALFIDAVLVTNKTREFERVPGLKIEDWTTTGD